MVERTCGDENDRCAACCKVYPILDLKKPAAEWCKHCVVGSGCQIYDSRPSDCSSYICEWRKGFGKEEDRPDRRRILLDFAVVAALDTRCVLLWEVSHGALESQYGQDLTRWNKERAIPLFYMYLSGRRVLFLSKEFRLTREMQFRLGQDNVEIKWYGRLL